MQTETKREPAIDLQNITFAYADRIIFDHLDLRFLKGHIHGILGQNGAGKSTLIKIISGLLRPSDGTIVLNGINTAQDFSVYGKYVGLLSDKPALYSALTVFDYLLFCAQIKKVHNAQHQVFEVMKKLDLVNVRKSIIQTLSTGYRQRVALAQALVHNPPILILDEPTSGLDPQSAANLRQILLELSTEHTILFSSHVLHEVQNICSHITMINQGKILFHGLMQDLLRIGDNVLQGKKIIKISFSSEQAFSRDDVSSNLMVDAKHVHQYSSTLFELEVRLNSKEELNLLVSKLIAKNFYIEQVTQRQNNLEDSFLSLIHHQEQSEIRP